MHLPESPALRTPSSAEDAVIMMSMRATNEPNRTDETGVCMATAAGPLHGRIGAAVVMVGPWCLLVDPSSAPSGRLFQSV